MLRPPSSRVGASGAARAGSSSFQKRGTDMARPLVTVAIPLYNGAAFLAETLESVLRQSFRDFELFISDDGSSDESLQLAKSYSDPRLRIEVHPHVGMAGNWNRCVRRARGRYLKVLPQDDVLRDDCLRESFALLRRSRDATLVFSRRDVLFDSADASSAEWVRLYGRLDEPLQPLETVNSGSSLLARWAKQEFHGNLIGEPVTTMFPTKLAKRLGGFPRRMYQDLDYAFWIRLIARGDVCFAPEPLCAYRFHAANATCDNYESGRLTTERFELLKTLAGDRAVRRHVPEVLRWMRAERSALRKERFERSSEAKPHVVGPIRTVRADLAAVLRQWIGAPRGSSSPTAQPAPAVEDAKEVEAAKSPVRPAGDRFAELRPDEEETEQGPNRRIQAPSPS